MANFWESAPLAAQPEADAWWKSAPVTSAPVAAPPAQAPPDDRAWYDRLGGAANDLVRGVADTATFGLMDEIAAGAGSLTGIGGERGNYDANLAQQRQLTKQSASDAGIVGTGVNIASSILGGQGLIKAGLPFLAGAAAPGASLGARIGTAAAAGGGAGALYGFGSGEGGFGNRAESAAQGGVIGGALGGAASGLVSGVGAAYRNVLGRQADNAVSQAAGVDPRVAGMLTRTMQADGTLGRQGIANMSAAGNQAMLADAGPNARAILDTAIQRGGPGATLAQQRISQRVGQSAQDINAALDANLGTAGESASREIVPYGTKVNPLSGFYQKAYDTPIDYSKPAAREIEDFIKTRVPATAIRAANDLMRVEGNQSKQILAQFDDADNIIGWERLPDVRQLDYITRGLKQVADQADGQGKLGGTTPIGRAYSNLSRDIRGRLKDIVPEYKTALDRAGTEIGKKEASDFGASIFNPSVSRAEVVDFTADLPGAEKNYLLQAIRNEIDNRSARTVRAMTDGDMDAREGVKQLRDLSSRDAREKLTAALGKQKAEPLFSEIDKAATSFDLRAAVAANSKTFARQATSQTVEDMTSPGAVKKALEGEPIKATKQLVQLLTGQTPEKRIADQDKIFSGLADLLTRPADSSLKTVQALQKYGDRQITNDYKVEDLMRLLRPVPAATSYGATTSFLPRDRKR